jgi:subtilisin family serine protease
MVEAIEWCIAQRIDVLSMSLGSPQPSAILQSVLHRAHQAGICCVAAAGNDTRAVAFPAAFDTVIAVGALGAFGRFPPDSAHALRIGRWTDPRGELFSAAFSNFGPEVAVAAPGVAVVSTVPTGYAAWDGTSMACPMVAALAALILQAHPWARTGDAHQPEYVRATLAASAVPLGMPGVIQGAGLPLATRALGFL